MGEKRNGKNAVVDENRSGAFEMFPCARETCPFHAFETRSGEFTVSVEGMGEICSYTRTAKHARTVRGRFECNVKRPTALAPNFI